MDRLLSVGEGRTLKRMQKIAQQINSIEDDYVEMDDDELRAQTTDFKQRLENGEDLDKLLPEAFATVREASNRVLGKRPFDVQLVGGIALHEANIAEMKTGEGKTIVALMPSYLNALSGEGVHVVTVNDYLAQYQSEQMGRVHHFLGLDVGVILSQMTPAQRRVAYNKDITYGTNNEFGFDYLRDNMALSPDDLVQRGHHYAIVDEVDSILVDEARTPLIISGPATENKQWYPVFSRLANRLKRDVDYEVDEKKRTVSVLSHGIETTEDVLGVENLYESANTPLIGYLNNSIRAKELFHRDRDYVVAQGEVLIVDEHTGRTLVGRRYNEGLHQALEAKEGVSIKDEYQTLATITLQNYFRMYDKLAGMTGTAKTEESEFQKIYGLGVLEIPTNKPMIRTDQSDLIYRTEAAKFDAIVADVAERYENGQPVLIGTASVNKSELLSKQLKKAGIPHEVLNAKQHAREAAIVAMAGRKGAVTVATNMAGRGTDIMLGGNPEFLADQVLQEKGIDPVENREEYEAEWPDTLKELSEQTESQHEQVVEAGGLYVVGSERHESRRIDNQLRGRSGRQGDPGESRFYLSLEDDLLRLFKGEVIERAMVSLNVPDDEPIEMKMITKAIESAQKQVEAQNFEMRKNVLKYDDVMNRQRHAIYGDRMKVLEGTPVDDQLRDTVDHVVRSGVQQYTTGLPDDWDLDGLWAEMKKLYPVTLDQDEWESVDDEKELADAFGEDAAKAYDTREETLGEENMRELERQVWLTVLDRKWREHLYEMDYLREGIGLRAMAQRDPLVEYQREGAQMFDQMRDGFSEEVVGYLFNIDVQVVPDDKSAAPQLSTDSAAAAAGKLGGVSAAATTGADEAVAASKKAQAAKKKTTAGKTAASSKPATSKAASTSTTAPKRRAGVDGAEPKRAEKVRIKGAESAADASKLSYSAPDEQGDADKKKDAAAAADPYAGVGRNQPCPCGSGKKFKMCHGRNPNAA
ncbi:preprotein translocase subunit SecA [Propionimicrobium sp. PCR01-08-3]|nr:preprotein translocase subunit SecA [Propionimicrobium sp. PCR01-08-3]WIY84186.1 preprotein translocase subunit SecA [Propionimicrobium sp. PCR01-08-3]